MYTSSCSRIGSRLACRTHIGAVVAETQWASLCISHRMNEENTHHSVKRTFVVMRGTIRALHLLLKNPRASHKRAEVMVWNQDLLIVDPINDFYLVIYLYFNRNRLQPRESITVSKAPAASRLVCNLRYIANPPHETCDMHCRLTAFLSNLFRSLLAYRARHVYR